MQLNPVNEDESDVFKLSNGVNLQLFIGQKWNHKLVITFEKVLKKVTKLKLRKWCDENVILIKNRNGMISFGNE